MIELNDIQADKIFEIMNVYNHHYNPAQYNTDEHKDKNPQYYFWAEKYSRSAFKLDRVTGEIKRDDLYEDSNKFLAEIKETLGKHDPNFDTSDPKFEEEMDKRRKVKEYLISEGLIEV